MSEFVPGSGDKRRTHEEESNLEISECYTFPRFPFRTLDFSARIRINPRRVEYDPDFIHAGAFVHIQVINLSLVK